MPILRLQRVLCTYGVPATHATMLLFRTEYIIPVKLSPARHFKKPFPYVHILKTLSILSKTGSANVAQTHLVPDLPTDPFSPL